MYITSKEIDHQGWWHKTRWVAIITSTWLIEVDFEHFEFRSSPNMSTEITCQHLSGTLLGWASLPSVQGRSLSGCMHHTLLQTWWHTWTVQAISSSETPTLGSSNIWGDLQLWCCGGHGWGHGRGEGHLEQGHLGHRLFLSNGQHLHVSTHWSGVPLHLHLRLSGLLWLAHCVEHCARFTPWRQPPHLPGLWPLQPSAQTPLVLGGWGPHFLYSFLHTRLTTFSTIIMHA